jgi:hypothetical protein
MNRVPDYWSEIESAWEAERPRPPQPRKLGPARSAGMAAAVLLGMQAALDPPKRDLVIIEVDIDQPARRIDGVTLHFDEGSPRRTVAVVGGS